jgi:hypothetical protein
MIKAVWLSAHAQRPCHRRRGDSGSRRGGDRWYPPNPGRQALAESATHEARPQHMPSLHGCATLYHGNKSGTAGAGESVQPRHGPRAAGQRGGFCANLINATPGPRESRMPEKTKTRTKTNRAQQAQREARPPDGAPGLQRTEPASAGRDLPRSRPRFQMFTPRSITSAVYVPGSRSANVSDVVEGARVPSGGVAVRPVR